MPIFFIKVFFIKLITFTNRKYIMNSGWRTHPWRGCHAHPVCLSEAEVDQKDEGIENFYFKRVGRYVRIKTNKEKLLFVLKTRVWRINDLAFKGRTGHQQLTLTPCSLCEIRFEPSTYVVSRVCNPQHRAHAQLYFLCVPLKGIKFFKGTFSRCTNFGPLNQSKMEIITLCDPVVPRLRASVVYFVKIKLKMSKIKLLPKPKILHCIL